MNLLNDILMSFEQCFTEPMLRTFICVIIGMMVRTDDRGMASLVRALHLDPNSYDSFEYFFKSATFKLKNVNKSWVNIVKKSAPLFTYKDNLIFVLDGVKQAKEGRRMIAVKRLHQESENSSKGEFIQGHMFGGVGILAGNCKKIFCIPLSMKLNDGLQTVIDWSKKIEGYSNEFEDWRKESHVVQMINQAYEAAKQIGKNAIVLADRYYPSVDLFRTLDALNGSSEDFKLYIVSKMKKNAIAYELPLPHTGRGRKALKGNSVKLIELFESKKSEFISATAALYGKEEPIKYYTTDLLWGKQYYKMLRFVVVEYNDTKSILISNNLELSGKEIAELYGYRFKIECSFRELKQVVHGFSYRFWNKEMPKLNRYKKKNDPDPLLEITDEPIQKKIMKTVRAIELFALCGCITLGCLQIISLNQSGKMKLNKVIFLRTYRSDIASEATITEYIRGQINHLLCRKATIPIIQKIKWKQRFDTVAAECEIEAAA